MSEYQLPPIGITTNQLEPYISKETINFHYLKHHKSYVDKLNAATQNQERISFIEHIKHSKDGIFNNAAQIWNHAFYWDCMAGENNQRPDGNLLKVIESSFGSFEEFKTTFTQSASGLFGSGWTWLVLDQAGKLSIVNASNAGNPITENQKPVLTCDVWEHAYYIDTRNDRGAYLNHFWSVVNWRFVSECCDRADVLSYQ